MVIHIIAFTLQKVVYYLMIKDLEQYIQLLIERKHKAAIHCRNEEYTALNKIIKELEAIKNSSSQTKLF